MKALKIILGILSVIVAAFLLMFPFAGQLIYVYVASIYVGIVGIVFIIDYCVNRKKRKLGSTQAYAGGLGVALAILAIIFMLLNITIPGFTFVTQELVAIILLIALLIEGIITIVNAFTYLFYSTAMRVLSVILGLLMVIAACAAFGCLPLIIGMMGIFTSIGFAVSGVSLIVNACTETAE